MLSRYIAIAALDLSAAAGAHAEWASPNPAEIVAQGQASQKAYVAPKAVIEAGERPDYLAAPAGQLTREQVNADTQRWMKDGLRQFGAGEGGALHYRQTREALKAYAGQQS